MSISRTHTSCQIRRALWLSCRCAFRKSAPLARGPQRGAAGAPSDRGQHIVGARQRSSSSNDCCLCNYHHRQRRTQMMLFLCFDAFVFCFAFYLRFFLHVMVMVPAAQFSGIPGPLLSTRRQLCLCLPLSLAQPLPAPPPQASIQAGRLAAAQQRQQIHSHTHTHPQQPSHSHAGSKAAPPCPTVFHPRSLSNPAKENQLKSRNP